MKGKKKMITDAVLKANRQNAQRSTGPRTERGKRASRAGAWKHGMTAKTLGQNWVRKGPPVPEQSETLVRRQTRSLLEQAFLREIMSLQKQLSRDGVIWRP